jgi:tetratricopeptide (TPR) repeat protein
MPKSLFASRGRFNKPQTSDCLVGLDQFHAPIQDPRCSCLPEGRTQLRECSAFWNTAMPALLVMTIVVAEAVAFPADGPGPAGATAHQASQGHAQDPAAQAQKALRMASTPLEKAAAHVVLGRAYLARGEQDKAEAEFKAALTLDPASDLAHLALGEVRISQQRLPEAEAEFREALRVAPNSAPAYEALSEILIRTGRGPEARPLLERAVRLDPQDWRNQYELAKLLMDSGEASHAAQMLESVSRLHPEFLPAREQLAMAELRRDDLKAATAQAESLLANYPHSAEGHRVMALILWKQRDYDGSLAECADALAADPDSMQMRMLQALELWQLDRKKQARQAFVLAAKGNSNPARLASPDLFCRLLLCDARDIGTVSDFLRKNRWSIMPASR